MIGEIFQTVLNLSIGAIPLMAVLMLLRAIFKNKVPRKVFYIAWALVLLRLMVPFSPESTFSIYSLLPDENIVETESGTSVVFVENSGQTIDFPVLVHPGDDNPNVDLPSESPSAAEEEKGPAVIRTGIDKNLIFGTVWIFGTAALLISGIIGYFAVLRKIKTESIPYTEKIRLSDFFKTPIVCGLFSPKIVLPMTFDLDDEAKVKSVISHECTHIRRKDNFWRLVASFTLYVHWFNPFVWLCYWAFIRDMEVSCDEAVLEKSREDIRSEYAESLIALSGEGIHPFYGGVLSFGESGIKERVKYIMNFKKAKFMIIILCVAVAVALGVIFLTNPASDEKNHEGISYEITVENGDIAVYDEETGIILSAKIKNTGIKTIWLSPATYIYANDEAYIRNDLTYEIYIGIHNNGGTIMLRPGETAVFCEGIPVEDIQSYAKNPYDGNLILEREIFADQGLAPIGMEAKLVVKLAGAKTLLSEDFTGTVATGPGADEFIPAKDMPEDWRLGTTTDSEHYENVIRNICLGNEYNIGIDALTVICQPNSENLYCEISNESAVYILEKLASVELVPATKEVNPSTGSCSFYIESPEGTLIRITYDGRVIVAADGGEKASIFDAGDCHEIFKELMDYCNSLLLEGNEYTPKPEDAPSEDENNGKNPTSAESKRIISRGANELIARTFSNIEKTCINTMYAEKILETLNMDNFAVTDEIEKTGNAGSPVDVIEFSGIDDGKKFNLKIHENGFVLSGSAVPEDEQGTAYISTGSEWKEVYDTIQDEFRNENYRRPYWFGLMNHKNIKLMIVSFNDNMPLKYVADDDCFGALYSIFNRARVQVPAEIIANSITDPSEDYIKVSVVFHTETEYIVYFTEDEITMFSSDMSYGIRYKADDSMFDELKHYAGEESSEANPATAKPVIYLYPEKETEVSVKLDFEGRLTYTYPALENGWKVLAKPDGELINLADGSTHYYLFWEGVADYEWPHEKGFCIKGSETEKFLRKVLPEMGLTPREYNDFITYWVPRMQENEYNLISFSGKEYSEIAKLSVRPKPESILRVHMVWMALDSPVEIEPQKFEKFERRGFTLVEWGGTEVFE